MPRADHGEHSYRGSGLLQGRRALITGGDSGIGRAVAIAFAREGADVAVSYLSEHDDAEETARWVREAGRRTMTIPGDLTDPDHCRHIVARVVEEWGGVDILVNNAGVHWEAQDFRRLDPALSERTFRTNVLSFLWVTQAAVDHMGEGGVILNTGSVTGLDGHPSLMDYAATKAAVHNLTKSLAAALAPRRIRVNCVAPGPVWTPLIPATRGLGKVEEFGADTIWQRPAQPAEIAPSYVFLASDAGRFYTGEILAPTGTPNGTR